MTTSATRNDCIRSVERAIDVLQALNLRPLSTLDDLHRETGLPKPSIVRLLRTLEAKGIAARSESYGTYHLLGAVRSLASGFHHEPLVVEAADTILTDFTDREGWPLSLALFDMDAVVVRACTINRTALSLEHAALNRRLSMVTRALGRAYLAFSPRIEQSILLSILRDSRHPEDAGARDRVAMLHMIGEITDRGYAMRELQYGERSSTLAVPVMQDGRLVATLGLTWINAAMNQKTALTRYLDKIEYTAGRIAAALDRPDSSSNLDGRSILESALSANSGRKVA